MKKLITLLLVLTGMVSTASATRIYFKPNSNWNQADAWFAVCQQYSNATDVSSNAWAELTLVTGTTDIYYADITLDNDCSFLKFVRMNPATSSTGWADGMNWDGARATKPTTTTYYELNSGVWDDWDTTNSVTATVPSGKTYTLSGYTKAGVAVAALSPDYTDANAGSGQALTSNGDFTYSRTVTGNYLSAGEYGFKLTDGTNWYGGNESAWNYACPITGISTSAAGVYSITYTFNFITGAISGTATRTADAVLTEKYIIAGDGAILEDHNWDTSGTYNTLTVEGTTGTLTINNVSLDAGYKYFKVVKLLCNNGAKYKTIYQNDPNSNYNFVRKSIYNLTFTCNTSELSSSLEASEVAGYFIFGGTGGGSWTLGQRLTESAGVYSAEIADKNYRFCIVANTNLTGENQVSNWNYAIKPEGTESDTNISWANSNGNTTSSNKDQTWNIPGAYADFPSDVVVKISYTPGETPTWAVSPYIMRTLPAAAEGYATFSTTVDVQADSRLTPKYASAVSAGAITWAAFTDRKIAKNEGALLTGGNAGWGYQFFPATSVTAPATNLMKPIATKSQLAQSTDGVTTYFILSKVADNLGFYKVNDSGSWCNAGTAYLQVDNNDFSPARAFFLFDDDSNTTAIEAVKKEQKMNGEYYNLAGQRVAQPTKGLYIVNGKKVIVK